MAKRMKTAAAPAITSLEELTARLGRFAALSAHHDQLKADAEAQIAEIRARFADAQVEIAAEMKTIILAAKPWWAANGDQLTDGKKKSVELAGCLIGERLSKPALAYPKPEEHAINLIEGHGWAALLRVKTELDKPMIMKALSFEGEDTAAAADDCPIAAAIDVRDTLRALGFSSAQKEEFFIARVADAAESTQDVADPTEQVAA